MKTFSILGLIALFLFLTGCSDDNDHSEISTIRIDHHYNTAIGVGPRIVLLVQKDKEIGKDKWSNFYSNIEGFDYEQGYVYDVSVKITENLNPMQDTSSLNYQLIDVIQKKEVPASTPFTIRLKSLDENFVTGNLENEFQILGKIDIDCNEICSQLSEFLEANETLSGEFIHSGENTIKLLSIN